MELGCPLCRQTISHIKVIDEVTLFEKGSDDSVTTCNTGVQTASNAVPAQEASVQTENSLMGEPRNCHNVVGPIFDDWLEEQEAGLLPTLLPPQNSELALHDRNVTYNVSETASLLSDDEEDVENEAPVLPMTTFDTVATNSIRTNRKRNLTSNQQFHWWGTNWFNCNMNLEEWTIHDNVEDSPV
eukprot:Platyproteum_vivax@DN4282_c0_g1_i2.p1